MVFATNSNEAEKLCKVTEYFFGVFGWRNFDVSELSLQRVRNRRLLRIQRELGLNEDSLHKYLTLLANYGFFTQKSCGEYSINTNGWLFTRPIVGERNKLLFNALIEIPGGLRVNAEQNIILTESGKEMVERFMRGMTRTFANFS